MVDTGVVRQTLRRIAHGVALSPGQSLLGDIWRLWTMDIIKAREPPLSLPIPKTQKRTKELPDEIARKVGGVPSECPARHKGQLSKNVLLCKELFCSLVLDFSTEYYLIAFNSNSDLSHFNP